MCSWLVALGWCLSVLRFRPLCLLGLIFLCLGISGWGLFCYRLFPVWLQLFEVPGPQGEEVAASQVVLISLPLTAMSRTAAVWRLRCSGALRIRCLIDCGIPPLKSGDAKPA